MLEPESGTRLTDLITRLEWDFEDDGTVDFAGPPQTAARVRHRYGDSGTYDVRLRVTGQSYQDGSTLTATNRLTLTVSEPPPPGQRARSSPARNWW